MIYIYIERERERGGTERGRERERGRGRERERCIYKTARVESKQDYPHGLNAFKVINSFFHI